MSGVRGMMNIAKKTTTRTNQAGFTLKSRPQCDSGDASLHISLTTKTSKFFDCQVANQDGLIKQHDINNILTALTVH